MCLRISFEKCSVNRALFCYIMLFLISRFTAQKMKFSIKDFFSKCDQFHRRLWIWSHLLKKFLIENFISCGVIKPCHYTGGYYFYLF